MAATLLAQQNAIPYEAIIHPGQRLHIHNPHIVPATLDDGILINLPQRMLFHFSQGKLRAAYPVGLGKPSWPTPQGEFRDRLAGEEQDLAGAEIHPGRNAPRGESRAGGSAARSRTIPWALTGSG